MSKRVWEDYEWNEDACHMGDEKNGRNISTMKNMLTMIS